MLGQAFPERGGGEVHELGRSRDTRRRGAVERTSLSPSAHTIYPLMKPLSLLLALGFGASLHAQDMDEPHRVVEVFRTVDAPAERVWEALVGDYGEISNYSPFIYASNYEAGSLEGEVGAERKCYFDAKSKKYSHERIAEIDADAMRMKNVILDVDGLPLDPDNSYAVYSVEDLGDGTSRAGYTFYMRTKPAFMGGLAAGSFEKSLNETLIGLEHYLTTGERVTGGSDNAEAVLKEAKSTGTYDDYEGSVRKVKT